MAAPVARVAAHLAVRAFSHGELRQALITGVTIVAVVLSITAIVVQRVLLALLTATLGAVLPWGGSGGSGGDLPPTAIMPIFAEVAQATGSSASILMAIAYVESRFNPRAVGPLIERFAGTEDAHALGMMQFLPSTYRAYAARVDRRTGAHLGDQGIWDPRSAVYAAAFFLKDMGGPPNWRAALMRYNTDPAYVDEVLRRAAAYADELAQTGVAARALAAARTQLGKPYVWGGSDEDGFDCSGLVYWAYRRAGLAIPRLTAEGYTTITTHLSRDELAPGDLVFFDGPDPDQPGVLITHVGLYTGNGQMIDAPAPGAVVRIEPLWRTFAGGGRLTAPPMTR